MGHNHFTGPLPASLYNGSKLVELYINGSNLIGKITIDFGGCLPILWWLVHASNSLGRGEVDGLSFFNSLHKSMTF
ncbi:hypothetical protein FH972_017224 [Carpinus fangiana]|uniref:Uncharacterized protein n=1 Tax=Carpinus fangiana TaxID=176857 RepID=A0A5N6RL94_9ROSI|nr:hypothetical protein FH972_017224 [Carpinus fangiana]